MEGRNGGRGVKTSITGQKLAPRGGMPAVQVVVTCEHAGRVVPREFAGLFRGAGELLRSHRGYDLGAAGLARELGAALGVEPRMATVSRLVIDLNRSIGNPRLFSEVMRGLDDSERQRVIDTYYRPHRDVVEQEIASHVRAGRRVLHIGVHTFTPVWKGRERTVDVGVLFDPDRRWELTLGTVWLAEMKRLAPELRIRRNLPYRGTTDGFVTYLRTRLSPAAYAGFELEVNNAIADGDRGKRLRSSAVRAVLHGLQLAMSRPDEAGSVPVKAVIPTCGV